MLNALSQYLNHEYDLSVEVLFLPQNSSIYLNEIWQTSGNHHYLLTSKKKKKGSQNL